MMQRTAGQGGPTMKYTARPAKRSFPKKPLIILAVIICVALAATIAVRHVYFEQLEAVSPGSTSSKLITVEKGASAEQIAKQLEDAGLIRSAWAFKLYISSKDVRDALQAGTYSFAPSQSVPQIVSLLTNGRLATDLVTILPAQRLDQIRSAKASRSSGVRRLSIWFNDSCITCSGVVLESFWYESGYK